ncbi:hypothetical protein MOQ26_07955 [Stenotrophomonas maltophilia]|nr:hypothetical protein [Stenotrophomonas maltophilia]
MTEAVAKFAEAPLGPDLLVLDGGRSLLAVGPAAGLNRMARADIGQSEGMHGVEFVFWGEAAATATVGVVSEGAATNAEVGFSTGIGWRLHTGEVFVDGVLVTSGIPVVTTAVIVGLRVSITDQGVDATFYRDAQVVAQAHRAAGPRVFFAVSLASEEKRELRCIVNAGQWRGRGAVSDGLQWGLPAEAVEPLRLGSEDYFTDAADDPADTPFHGLLQADGLNTVASVSFWPWDNASRGGTAAVRILDAEGRFDGMALGAMRNVPVRISQVQQGAPLSSAEPVGRYVLDRVDIESDGVKSLVLRDAHDDLDRSLHQAVFLPSVSDSLAWAPQPVVIGCVRSVPTTGINSDGSVRWVSDAPLRSLGAVLDRGAALDAGDGYGLSTDGQQIALKSPPLGPVIADVSTQEAMAPATLQQFLANVFGRLGKSAWDAAGAAQIDALTGYAGIGYYAGEGATARTALQSVLPSYGADWWQDAAGVLRIARLIAPEETPDDQIAFNVDWRELGADLIVLPDLAPNLSRRMAFQLNAQPLSSADLITDLVQLPPQRRQELTSPQRGQVYAAGELARRYAHADAAAPMLSWFDRREDAQAEIDRLVAIYSVPRNFYAGKFAARPDLRLQVGQVGQLTYSRYGLQAGRKVLVTGVMSNPVTGTHTIKFWGM